MNNSHIDIESLSAFLDGEVPAAERARVQAHLASCAACNASRERLQNASARLAGLGRVQMTADEHRTLRQTLLRRSPARASGRWQPGRLQWSLAGAFALVAVAIVGFSMMRPHGRDNSALTQAAAPSQADTSALSIDSDDQIRGKVLALPEVRSSTTAERDSAAALKAEAPGSQAESATTGSADARAGEPAPVNLPFAASNGSGGGAGAPFDFSNGAGTACSAALAAGEQEPLVPLVTRQVTYKGREAWLAVYRTADDRLLALIVDPADCAQLTGGALDQRVLSRQEFSPSQP